MQSCNSDLISSYMDDTTRSAYLSNAPSQDSARAELHTTQGGRVGRSRHGPRWRKQQRHHLCTPFPIQLCQPDLLRTLDSRKITLHGTIPSLLSIANVIQLTY
uniref:Uncharacterized protein n=1 Tax=Falco tinnunculus TaxID=100819 RepID=A0A8C4XTX2_FALTI